MIAQCVYVAELKNSGGDLSHSLIRGKLICLITDTASEEVQKFNYNFCLKSLAYIYYLSQWRCKCRRHFSSFEVLLSQSLQAGKSQLWSRRKHFRFPSPLQLADIVACKGVKGIIQGSYMGALRRRNWNSPANHGKLESSIRFSDTRIVKFAAHLVVVSECGQCFA